MAARTLRTGMMLIAFSLAGSSLAQTHTAPGVDGSGGGGSGGGGAGGGGKTSLRVIKVPDPNSPAEVAYRESQKKRVEMDKDLRKIRAQYFRGIRNTEIRQVGLSKLRAFNDPAVYPTLLDLFAQEDKDVRAEVLQLLVDQNRDEADAAIAWAAVFDNDKWFRDEATKRLLARIKDPPSGVSDRVKSVIAFGLRDQKNQVIAAAAQMAAPLKLYEAIPMLINTQVQRGGSAAGTGTVDRGDGALAYIMIAQQVAFVSDLTPVVGDSAVAFDPTVAVATEGNYIRVIDAVVITYLTEVNRALIALGNAGWDGRDTSAMGWDQKKWQDWYAAEFKPYRDRIEAQKKEVVKNATPG
ncbi:MAG: hypothetical protein IT438_08820 [Phycisphaerales bacterium]|nr:hypothetical protein [Phycisphaerales bacterium]